MPGCQERTGLFITFEGPEGSGKTTQIRLLEQSLRRRGHVVTVTREPGGTHLGDAVRSLLLQRQDISIGARAEALLFNAARAQLVDEVIRPALDAGQIILCDRYIDSTLAYQGYGRRMDADKLSGVIDFATGTLLPDLTVFLDIEPQQGLQRKQADTHIEWNRLDQETLDFHHAVRAGYQHLIEADPQRWVVVDASRDRTYIQDIIWGHVQALLRNKDLCGYENDHGNHQQ